MAERKARFRAALAIARMTAAEWGKENGASESFLSRLLVGKTVSAPMTAKIDAFIAKHIRRLSRSAS